jgi:hypothetical protein
MENQDANGSPKIVAPISGCGTDRPGPSYDVRCLGRSGLLYPNVSLGWSFDGTGRKVCETCA